MKQEQENKIYKLSRINRTGHFEHDTSMKNRMDRIAKIDKVRMSDKLAGEFDLISQFFYPNNSR